LIYFRDKINKKCQKSCINYHCKDCDYSASNKANYDKHILTRKHKNRNFLELNSISSIEKTPKKVSKVFTCENCNFDCKKQNEYNRHIITQKHIDNMSEMKSRCKYETNR